MARAQALDLNEVLDTTNLVWTTGADAPWFGQTTNTHDTIDAARSGMIGPGQTSWLETKVIGPATLRYWTKTSREASGFGNSWLYFLASHDPNPYPETGPVLQSPRGSASNPWIEQTHDLEAGTNVLRWSFVNHGATNTSDHAVLDEVKIAPPRPLEITYQPSGLAIFSRGIHYLSVSVIGTPPYVYQWRKDEAALPQSTNAWLVIDSATTNDSGSYSVLVTNMHGWALSSNAVLTVLPPSAPIILNQPNDTSVYAGQYWSMHTSGSGSPPFTYQWLKDGTNLSGEISSSLYRTNAQLSDAGVYSLQISNAEGSVVSSNVVLTVLASGAPTITAHPQSLNMVSGSTLRLAVQATGQPEPQYQWLRNGTNILGARSSSFSLSSVSAADSGVYSVIASNFVGKALSQEALIQVLPPLAEQGSWFQTVNQVAVRDGLAFIAQGSLGVGILSLADANYPAMIGGYNTDGQANAVHVSGNFAYVADGLAGLHILAITNPAHPIKIGTYNSPGNARDVAVSGNYAFLADAEAGLHVLDVSDPSQPIRVGGFVTNMSAGTVRVANGLAYVGCPSVVSPEDNPITSGLQILDISVPARPVLLGRTSQAVSGLDILGTTVLTVGNSSAISLVDVSDPTAPSWISSGTSSRAYDVALAGNLACVVSGSQGLWIFDVSNPSAPVNVARFATAGSASKLCVDGNRVYVALNESGLQIIELPSGLGVQSAASVFIALSSGLKLSVDGSIGARYSVETTQDLGAAWEQLQIVTLSNGPVTLDLGSDSPGQRFFRTRLVQPNP